MLTNHFYRLTSQAICTIFVLIISLSVLHGQHHTEDWDVSGKPSIKARKRAEKVRSDYQHEQIVHPLEIAKKACDSGNVEEAIRLYELEKKSASEYPEAQLALAHLYDWTGKLKKSIKAYQNLKPNSKCVNSIWREPNTQFGYSSSMAQAGRWAEAIQIFEYSQDREYDPDSKSADRVPLVYFRPNYVETNKLVAWTDYLLGRHVYPDPCYRREEELRHLRRAVKLQPTFYEAHAVLGMALIGQDRKSVEGRAHLAIAAPHTSDPALKEKYYFWAGTPLPGKVSVTGRDKDGKLFLREVAPKPASKRP